MTIFSIRAREADEYRMREIKQFSKETCKVGCVLIQHAVLKALTFSQVPFAQLFAMGSRVYCVLYVLSIPIFFSQTIFGL